MRHYLSRIRGISHYIITLTYNLYYRMHVGVSQGESLPQQGVDLPHRVTSTPLVFPFTIIPPPAPIRRCN